MKKVCEPVLQVVQYTGSQPPRGSSLLANGHGGLCLYVKEDLERLLQRSEVLPELMGDSRADVEASCPHEKRNPRSSLHKNEVQQR